MAVFASGVTDWAAGPIVFSPRSKLTAQGAQSALTAEPQDLVRCSEYAFTGKVGSATADPRVSRSKVINASNKGPRGRVVASISVGMAKQSHRDRSNGFIDWNMMAQIQAGIPNSGGKAMSTESCQRLIHPINVRQRLVEYTVLVALVCIAGPTLSWGDIQNDVVGFSPNHAFENALAGENIDLMSGNLNLTIPIGPRFKVTDDYSYQINLYYNSKIWEHDCRLILHPNLCNGAIAVPDTYGLGFRISFGRIYQAEPHNDDQQNAYSGDDATTFRYQSPDGADHFFCSGGQCHVLRTDGQPESMQQVTFDGTGVQLEKITSQSECGTTNVPAKRYAWVAYPGDGTKVTFDHCVGLQGSPSAPRNGWYASKIEPLTTNASEELVAAASVTINYQTGSDRVSSITDSTGRTITFNYSDVSDATCAPASRPCHQISISVPAFGGASTETYTLDLQSLTLTDPVERLDPPNDPLPMQYSRSVLKRITYEGLDPTNEAYQFGYGLESAANTFGYLASRTLPTGALVEYFYGHYSAGTGRPYKSEVRYKKLTLPHGATGQNQFRWSYDRFGDGVIRTYQQYVDAKRAGSFSASNASGVWVLDPFDNLTVYRFNQTIYAGCIGTPVPGVRCGNCESSTGVCDNNWDDGLLNKVETYAGPDANAERLMQRTEYSYAYDGMFQYRSYDQVGTFPIVNPYSFAVSSRKMSETTTYPGGGESPSKSHRVEFSDWAPFYDITGATIPTVQSKTKKEYDEENNLYRITHTDYVPDRQWHEKHNYVEVRNAAGEVVSRTEKKFRVDRVECEVRRKSVSASPPTPITNCAAISLAPGDVEVANSYDPNGNLLGTAVWGGDDGGSRATVFTYDVAGDLLTKRYGVAAQFFDWLAINRTVDAPTGLVSSTTDPSGAVTTYYWDGLGRLKNISPQSPEVPTTISYPTVKETGVRQTAVGDGNYVESLYTYDDLGRVIRTRKRNLQSTYDFQKTEYDILGRVVRRSEWAAEGTADSALQWTAYDFTVTTDTDSATGQPVRHADPLGRIRRVVAPDGATTETDYQGFATIVTTRGIQGLGDPPGNGTAIARSTYVKDAFGRLVEVDADGPGARAQYRYDERDNLVGVKLIDPASSQNVQTREFIYDPLGRLRESRNPESETTDYLSYDARGNVLEYQDARQNHFLNVYDAADRLVSHKVRIGYLDYSLLANVYDANSGFEAGSAKGKLTEQRSYQVATGTTGSLSSLVSTAKYHYGPVGSASACQLGVQGYSSGLNGRLSWQQVVTSPWSKTVQTDFCQNELGQEYLVAYPETIPSTGRTRTRLGASYKNGVLWELHDLGRNIEYVRGVTYAPSGVVRTIERGNHVVDNTELDTRQRPSQIQVLSPENSIPGVRLDEIPNCDGTAHGPQHLQYCGGGAESLENGSALTTNNLRVVWDSGLYSYDKAGNVATIGTDSYYYDELSRLVGGQIWRADTTYNLAYQYDPFGNMQVAQKAIAGGTIDRQQFTIDQRGNRLTHQSRTGYLPDEIDYAYDDTGNVVSALTAAGEGRGFSFDQLGHLDRVTDDSTGTVATYNYDGNGNRVYASAGGTETFYFRDRSGQVLSEFSRPAGTTGDPAWDKDYIYSFGKVLTLVKNEVPQTPKKPWATGVSTTGLTLNWAAVDEPDILGYGIVRTWKATASSSEAISPTINIPAGTLSYHDTFPSAATAATVVKYTVRAIDTASNISDASPTLVVRPGGNPPSAPINVRALAGDRQVRVTWSRVTGDDISGYLVERISPADTTAVIVDPGYIDSGLTNSQAYTYRVFAKNTSGRLSAPSIQVTATPFDSIPPAPPLGVRAGPSTFYGSIVIQWNIGPEQDLYGYDIYRSTSHIFDDGTVVGDDSGGAPPSFVLNQVGVTGTFRDVFLSTGATGDPVPTYYYRIRARDYAGNVSAYSAEVSAKPRTSRICRPGGLHGNFQIDSRGTVSSDGLPYPGNPDGGNLVAEDDDVVQVHLDWSSGPLGPPCYPPSKYRVYRGSSDNSDFRLIQEIDNPTYLSEQTQQIDLAWSYDDNTPVESRYTYFVVGVRLIAGSYEESEASNVMEIIEPFPDSTHSDRASVRNVVAYDSLLSFQTFNSASRYVRVKWSRVVKAGLKGYHVYRKCEPRSAAAGVFSNDVCEYRWVRLTREPVPEAAGRNFVDETVGGLGGVFDYAVRPVGPGDVEGPIGKAVQVWLDPNYANGASPVQSTAANYTWWSWDFWSSSASGVEMSVELNDVSHRPRLGENQIARGGGSSEGAPPKPNAGVAWIVKDPQVTGQAPTRAASVGFQFPGHSAADQYGYLNAPADLAGFRIEMAGSSAGPWVPVTQNLIAWWEREYFVQGLGVQVGTSSPAVFSGHTECMWFRVIAVDEEGNESVPSDPVANPPGGCDTDPPQPTLPAPQNLRASSCGSACTKLDWDAVDEAVTYQIYRFKVHAGSYYFYNTQTQSVSEGTSYSELGQDVLGRSSDPNDDCPYYGGSAPAATCRMDGLDAFFVTARRASGGESPRSNVVFWDSAAGGYSELRTDHETYDAVAFVPSVPSRTESEGNGQNSLASCEAQLVSSADASRSGGQEGVHERPIVAPMIKLGAPVDPPWKLHDLHTDHLGSVRLETDMDGRIESQHDYFPFGEEIAPMLDYNTHMFTGHERDKETGLDYMLARYYSSSLSRFLSADPGDDTELESPQSWNKYLYVRDNPLKYLDPTGEGTEVHTFVRTYPVSGNTAAEAWHNAEAQSADGFPGHTSWDIAVTNVESMEVASEDLGSAVSIPTDVSVSVDATISVPDWKAPTGAGAGEQQKFDSQRAGLEKHEQGHVDIARQGGQTLEKTIKNNVVGVGQGANPAQAKTSARNDLVKKSNDARRQQKAKTEQKQKQYDKRTNHGRRQP